MGAGTESCDFFGFAQGKDDGRYLGFTFGKRTSLFLDSSLLLIEPVTAAAYAEEQRSTEETARPKPTEPTPSTTGNGAPPPKVENSPAPTYTGGVSPQPVKKQFYGSIELDAIQAKKQFADLVDEVVLQFTSRPGVKVKIAIEIQAEVILKGTRVDGIYTADPQRDPTATRYASLTFDEADRLLRATTYATRPQTVWDDFAKGKVTPEEGEIEARFECDPDNAEEI